MSLNELLLPNPKPWCNLNANSLSVSNGISYGPSSPSVSSVTILGPTGTQGVSESFMVTKTGMVSGLAAEFFNLQLPNANCAVMVYIQGVVGISSPTGSIGQGSRSFVRVATVSRDTGSVATGAICTDSTDNSATDAGSGFTGAMVIDETVTGGASAVNVFSLRSTATLANGATAYDGLFNISVMVQHAEGQAS